MPPGRCGHDPDAAPGKWDSWPTGRIDDPGSSARETAGPVPYPFHNPHRIGCCFDMGVGIGDIADPTHTGRKICLAAPHLAGTEDTRAPASRRVLQVFR